MFVQIKRYLPEGRWKQITINTDNICFAQPGDGELDLKEGVEIKIVDGSWLVVDEDQWRDVLFKISKEDK